MRAKLSFLLLLFLFLSCIISANWADVINPGEKTISYQYQISNIQDYPNYVFILHGTPNPSLHVLNSSSFSFYKLSTCRIYAIPQSVYRQVQPEEMNETQLVEFLNNDSRVARSSQKLEGSYGTVGVDNPLLSVLVILKINSIQGNSLELIKEKVVFTYNNGQKEEKVFQNQNQTPTPSSNLSYSQNYFFYIIIPLIALLALIIILIMRRRFI